MGIPFLTKWRHRKISDMLERKMAHDRAIEAIDRANRCLRTTECIREKVNDMDKRTVSSFQEMAGQINCRMIAVVDEFERSAQEFGEMIAELNEEMQGKFTNHGHTLYKLKKGVASLFQKVNPMEQKVVELTASMTTCAGVVNDMAKRLLMVEKAIEAVDEFVGDQRKFNSRIESSVDTAKTDIQRLYESVNSLEETLGK